jgi:hypothetical protein
MKKTIVTRSQNEKLYKIAKALLSDKNEFIQCKQFKGFEGALNYLKWIFETQSGWVVNIDEDCFIVNESLIDICINQMKRNGWVYCGVPDGGGLIPHRSKSKYTANPFFNIFNVDAIKEKWHTYSDVIDFELIKKIEPNYNLDEPFAWLFYWMFKNFESAEFSDIDSTDGTSTIINVNKKPMLIHSWYSRMYDKDVAQTERINKCIEWAIIQKVQG